jgi:hypothetical protein
MIGIKEKKTGVAKLVLKQNLRVREIVSLLNLSRLNIEE